NRMTTRHLTLSWRTAAWPALAGLAVIVAHLPSFVHRLLDGDEAIYGSIAVLMNLGGGLYGAGGVDNKPPGIFWVYALTFRVSGAYQMTAIHAVGFAPMALSSPRSFKLARYRAGTGDGISAS